MAEDKLLTPAEVARLFRVNAKTVTRWAQRGKIRAIRTLATADIASLKSSVQSKPLALTIATRPVTPDRSEPPRTVDYGLLAAVRWSLSLATSAHRDDGHSDRDPKGFRGGISSWRSGRNDTAASGIARRS